MSYQPGRMGVGEGIGILFALTVVRVFLSTPVTSIERGAGTGWLFPMIGGAFSFIPLWLLLQLFKTEKDFLKVLLRLVGKAGALLICLYYITAFFLNASSLVRQFAENTLLTGLPQLEFGLAVILYGIMAAFVVFDGIEGLARVTYLMLPFMVAALSIVLLALLPEYNIYNLLPLYGNGWRPMLIGPFLLGGTNLGAVAIAILAPSFQNYRSLLAITGVGLISTTLIRSAVLLVFTMVYSVPVAVEKVLPFYEMARAVSLSRFFQRIEALFILVWVIIGVVSVGCSLYLVAFLIVKISNMPAVKPVLPAVAVLAVTAAMMPSDIMTVIDLDTYELMAFQTVGVYLIPLFLYIVYWIKMKRGNLSCTKAE